MENNKKLRQATREEIQEAVRKFQKKKNKEPKIFWNTIKALHSVEDLKNWLPLESMPLMPFVEKKDKSLLFYLLFVSPNSKTTIGKPWGMAVLALPEAKVLFKIKFDASTLEKIETPDLKMLCNKRFIDMIQKAFDENSKIPLPPKEIIDIFAVLPNKLTESNNESENFQPISERIPSNWSDLLKYMDDISKMLKEESQKELLKELYFIKKRLEQPLFSVAVIGKSNCSKSTFLNNLIGSELLPVGDLPTTAMLTKIVYGKKQRFFIFHEGKKEEISAETLKSLTTDGNGNDSSSPILAETPFNFLNKNGIQFIDTPETEDLFSTRAAITTETIASCDATILTVNATMPLSLTEKSFVEDNIILKAIPRVAVVVTGLDKVTEKERNKVYENIKIEVSKWNKNIPVWVSGINIERFGEGIVFGKDEILAKITKWAQDSGNDKIRMLQIYAQTNLIKVKFEHAKQIKKEEQAILNQDLIWENVALEIKKREITFSNWLREILEGKASDIKEDFLFQAKNSPDPQIWWNEQFPFILKKKIQDLSKELSGIINRKIIAESEQTANFIKQKLDSQSEKKEEDNPQNILNSPNTKILSAVQIPIPRFPIGTAVNAVNGLISGKITKGEIDIAKHTDAILTAVFNKIVESYKNQISKDYAIIVREIQNENKLHEH